MLLMTLVWTLLAIHSGHCQTVPRDVGDIISSLNTISNQLVTMNNTLNQFEGGFNGTLLALEIQEDTSTLLTDINQGTTTAQQLSPLDDSDSATVAFAIVSLSSKIYGVLDNLIVKKAAFDSAILGIASASFLVKSDLESLRNNTAAFGQTLTAKFDAVIKQLAPLVTSDIDFHFSQAISVYS